MRQNLAYIISLVNKSKAFEWVAELLDSSKYNLFFILLNDHDTPLEQFLENKGIKVFRVNYSGKKDFMSAFFKVKKILKNEKTDIVHAHLFDACLIGLAAARFAGIKKRIHTRHNSTIHHDYHPHAVKYDRIINYLSTEIIANSVVVKKVLIEMEGVAEKKIKVIHHGFRFNEFDEVTPQRINALRDKYKTDPLKKNIGVISRYIHWKGLQYIIPAFAKFLIENPDSHLILANADGPYKKEIKDLLHKLPLNSYTEIPFEEDAIALYHLFDVFVHTPINEKSEAFGQVFVEAMASGIPSVVTLSGIACEFVKHRQNALVVPFENSEAICENIKEIFQNETVRDQVKIKAREDVERLFGIEKMIKLLEETYG